MKILVVEDRPKHQESVREQLAEHELTIVSSFRESWNLLVRKFDQSKVDQILGVKTERYFMDPRSEAWDEAREKAEEASLIPVPFEVVLTDMCMEGWRRKVVTREGRRYSQRVAMPEMPLGLIIALMAADRGVKYIAVVTDRDHHHTAAAIDQIQPLEYFSAPVGARPAPNFTINDSRVMFVVAPYFYGDRPNTHYVETADRTAHKDWERVLRDLTSTKV